MYGLESYLQCVYCAIVCAAGEEVPFGVTVFATLVLIEYGNYLHLILYYQRPQSNQVQIGITFALSRWSLSLVS